MLRKLFLLVLAGLVCFGGAACEKKKTQAELQAEKVKAFRERQKKAADKAYQDLVNNYPKWVIEQHPESPLAAEAKKKLQTAEASPASAAPPK